MTDRPLQALHARLARRMRTWFDSMDIGGNGKKRAAAQRTFDIRPLVDFALEQQLWEQVGSGRERST